MIKKNKEIIILVKRGSMFFYFEILPRIHKNHAADPNGSADPRLGSPVLEHGLKSSLPVLDHGP